MTVTLQKKAEIEQRRKVVLDYVLQGYTLRMIASVLQENRETVRKDYHAALEHIYHERKEMGELVVQDQLQRIDRIVDMLESKIETWGTGDNARYDDRLLNTLARYLEMRARLLAMPGYTGNAPQQTTAMQINISYNGNGASAVPQYEVSRDTVPGKAKRIPAGDE
jgi:hypothetical protein